MHASGVLYGYNVVGFFVNQSFCLVNFVDINLVINQHMEKLVHNASPFDFNRSFVQHCL